MKPMPTWQKLGLLGFLVFFVWVLVTSYLHASDLKYGLGYAGFEKVQQDNILVVKATSTVHGCNLGFDRDNTISTTRTVNGHEVEPYNVSAIDGNGTWTAIRELANKASTPDEVGAFLSAHRDKYPCYKP